MNYEWAEGFHPPKGVGAEDVKHAVDRLKEPSPEALLQASKNKRHVLYGDLWSEGDQVWAQRGRLERCRRILGSICEVVVAGKKTISVRAVEYVRTNGDGRWFSIESIRSDPELMDAYLSEVQRLQEQATGKMEKLRQLMVSGAD